MKRCLRSITVYVVLGALINVAFAWTIALTHREPRSGPTAYSLQLDTRAVMIWRTRSFGHELISPIYPPWQANASQGNWDRPFHGHYWWPRGIWDLNTENNHPLMVAVGWPFMSLGTWRVGSGPFHYGVLLDEVRGRPRGRRISPPHPVVIPMWPIASGFILNTLTYGASSWMLVGAARRVRRVMRSHGDRCSRCGYPRENHIICPECGTAHKHGMSEPIAQALPPA